MPFGFQKRRVSNSATKSSTNHLCIIEILAQSGECVNLAVQTDTDIVLLVLTVYAVSGSSAPAKWWIWGSSDHGQFGIGEKYSLHATPIEIHFPNALGVGEVSVGMNTCVAKSRTSANIYVWGENANGSILSTTDEDISSPTLLGHGTSAFAGWNSIWIVDENQRSLTYHGPHRSGERQGGADSFDITQIVSSAFQTAFLRKNGSVIFGNNRSDVEFQDTAIPPSCIQISAGWSHFLMLHRDGSLWAVGANKHGQCGVGHSNHLKSYDFLLGALYFTLHRGSVLVFVFVAFPTSSFPHLPSRAFFCMFVVLT